jgi:hypothetical protein
MSRQHKYYHNGHPVAADEALDAKGQLKDGYTARVAAYLRDSSSDIKVRITDASNGGDPTAGHRPGFRIATLNAHLTDEPGSVGHDERPARHRFDGMTVDQISRWHQQNMRRIYDEIERELAEAWRRS